LNRFFGHDLPVAVANLASMLPSVPISLGRLSEVYLSAYLALSSAENPLKLAQKKSYLVILVDGLGVSNIRNAGGHAGFLNHRLKSSKSLFSGFPATTTSSLVSLATGEPNGSHAVLGHRVYDRDLARNINFLNDLGAELDPRKYQHLETISERAAKQGVKVSTIGPAEYDRSGFTLATMPNAEYITAASFQDRFASAKKALANSNSLTYLYFPELDQLAHRFGSNSTKWLEAIEELDSELAKFAKSLANSSGVVLTADHGVIDVAPDRHVYLDEHECFDDLEQIGGDPRVGFLYFQEGIDLESKRAQITEAIGMLSEVVTVDELVDTGWLTRFSDQAKLMAPDLVLLPKSDRVIYHRGFAKARSLLMIGQHGGMTQAEWEVPLIVF
jgi:predicted AlkP superfamily pyrophosphatase or phosphodiesterase